MNQRKELHLLGPDNLIDYVWIVPIVHIHEVLVSCYERLLSQLCFQVDSQGLNPVAH